MSNYYDHLFIVGYDVHRIACTCICLYIWVASCVISYLSHFVHPHCRCPDPDNYFKNGRRDRTQFNRRDIAIERQKYQISDLQTQKQHRIPQDVRHTITSEKKNRRTATYKILGSVAR